LEAQQNAARALARENKEKGFEESPEKNQSLCSTAISEKTSRIRSGQLWDYSEISFRILTERDKMQTPCTPKCEHQVTWYL
jgi:hypothetical protein